MTMMDPDDPRLTNGPASDPPHDPRRWKAWQYEQAAAAKALEKAWQLEKAAEALKKQQTAPADPVNHPAHYTQNPSGVECIQVVEHMGFNVGNAIKYLWRCDLKASALEDLRKAAWYVQREIERRQKILDSGRIGHAQER